MAFVKATREKAKLRLALTGPAGSGKTLGALLIAKGLGGRTAFIDTERGSARLYSDVLDFDVLELAPPFTPEAYIAAINDAVEGGYSNLIIDSTSHEWSGTGGCLEINEATAKAKYKGNTWSAWNDTTPRHRKFIDAMLQANLHIIATGRSKTETAQVEENGRKKVAKLGMKTEQRDGFEYEFTVVLDISHDGHFAVPSKDRTGVFRGDPQPITEETGKRLLAWLDSGAEPSEKPVEPTLADRLIAIKSATTMDELKTVYLAAAKAAQKLGDDHALALFTDEKEAMKLKLTTKEAA
jgi:hypothetical protein